MSISAERIAAQAGPGLARRRMTRGVRIGPNRIISWDDVELISTDEPLRLKVPVSACRSLHPATWLKF